MNINKIILIAFIVWMLTTLFLVISVVGILLLIPQSNYTGIYKSQGELRSTWMRIGYDLKDKLINDEI